MLLSDRDPAERMETQCHNCDAASRYIHAHKSWCRTCLDIEQYPQLAHLTQDEREQLRMTNSKGHSNRGMINADSFKSQKVGFAE